EGGRPVAVFPAGRRCPGRVGRQRHNPAQRPPDGIQAADRFERDNEQPASSISVIFRAYLPITRIVNEPGITGAWGPRPPAGGGVAGGGGAGPRSTLIVRMWFVLLSNVTVRAPFIV